MEPTSSAIGLIVIVVLYVTIGVMSAAGSVYISRSIFSLLHIPWDAVHEFNAHAGGSLRVHRQITSVPLRYGFFCTTYDFLMATYFYTRRNQWRATWRASLRDGTTM